MITNYLKQNSFYFLGIFLGLASRIKKIILGLSSPRPRMIALNNYEKNLNYDYKVLNTISSFSGETDFFNNKKILEIGPGPDLMLGLLTLEAGALSYQAIDFFPVLSAPVIFYEKLKKILTTPRALKAVDQTISSLSKNIKIDYPEISYHVLGIADLDKTKNKYDLIFSKDVLEHVTDLNLAFKAMKESLNVNGKMIHKIDFQTHISFIQDRDRLNLLRYSDTIYNNLVKFKGGPNRLRLPEVLDIAKNNGFKIEKIDIDKSLTAAEFTAIKGYLNENYRNLPDDYLTPLSAWIIFTPLN